MSTLYAILWAPRTAAPMLANAPSLWLQRGFIEIKLEAARDITVNLSLLRRLHRKKQVSRAFGCQLAWPIMWNWGHHECLSGLTVCALKTSRSCNIIHGTSQPVRLHEDMNWWLRMKYLFILQSNAEWKPWYSHTILLSVLSYSIMDNEKHIKGWLAFAVL